MADKDITIGIKTTADTSGADKAVDAINKVPGAIDRIPKVVPKAIEAINKVPDAIGEIPKEIPRVVDAINKLPDALRETTAELEQLDQSSSALNNKLTVTGNTSEGVASKMGGKLRGTFQQAGYQVQDFATQVAMGTSAVTAFGQQAPQLLGAFGPAGAIAGAFVSIGALAYGVFSKMGDNVLSATEKLKEMEVAADAIVKNKGLELEDEFTDSARAIDNAVSRAAALKQEFIETKKAVNALALAQLDLAAENAKSARRDMEIKGRPANMKQKDWELAMAPLKAIEEASTASAAKFREQARQALVTDQDRLKTAQEAAAEAAKMLVAREAEKAKAVEMLATERELLEVIRQQKKAKEDIVKAGTGPVDRTKSMEEIDETYKKKSSEIKNAKADLAGGSPFVVGLRVAEERIAKLEEALASDGSKLNTDITAAQDKLAQLKTKLTDTTAAVTVEAATINSDLERKTTEEIGVLKQAGLDTAKTVTDAAKDAIAAVEQEAANQKRGLNPPEQDAVARIRKLVEDTIPDSAQGGQLQGVLQSLANNLTAKDKQLAAGVERLIAIVRLQSGQYSSLLSKITDLENRAKQVK